MLMMTYKKGKEGLQIGLAGLYIIFEMKRVFYFLRSHLKKNLFKDFYILFAHRKVLFDNTKNGMKILLGIIE